MSPVLYWALLSPWLKLELNDQSVVHIQSSLLLYAPHYSICSSILFVNKNVPGRVSLAWHRPRPEPRSTTRATSPSLTLPGPARSSTRLTAASRIWAVFVAVSEQALSFPGSLCTEVCVTRVGVHDHGNVYVAGERDLASQSSLQTILSVLSLPVCIVAPAVSSADVGLGGLNVNRIWHSHNALRRFASLTPIHGHVDPSLGLLTWLQFGL